MCVIIDVDIHSNVHVGVSVGVSTVPSRRLWEMCVAVSVRVAVVPRGRRGLRSYNPGSVQGRVAAIGDWL